MNLSSLHQLFLKSSGICTDTRKIKKDCLFFALKGAHFNGNTFAQEALQQGALAAVIDEKEFEVGASTLYCPDALQTLQDLATFHRKYLRIPILSLTGSNGKTTTKELIHAVLSKKFECVATEGNLNNHIGVPLTLLKMTPSTQFGIVEMGANHQGEIAVLCEIAQPNYGYITNFGKAHLEGFGGVEGVIKGKSELYKFLQKTNGRVFVNGRDAKQLELTEGIERTLFNKEHTNKKITLLPNQEFVGVRIENTSIQTHLTGAYNFSNIAAAISMGYYFDIPLAEIKQALESYIPQMNRSQILEHHGHRIIMDAYNANPTSMIAAIHNIEEFNAEKKCLILGDMFELGTEASKEHQAITDYLEKSLPGKIFLVGENFYRTINTSAQIEKFETFDSFKVYLSKHPIPSSLILIKGSRGMALERCLAFL